jgi:hypothetical protein
MAKFEARKKEYEGWTNEKQIRILRRLHSIIKERVFVAFAVTLVLADYNEIMTDEVQDYFGNPHQFVNISCMNILQSGLLSRAIKSLSHMYLSVALILTVMLMDYL